jgi:hypothetical protein
MKLHIHLSPSSPMIRSIALLQRQVRQRFSGSVEHLAVSIDDALSHDICEVNGSSAHPLAKQVLAFMNKLRDKPRRREKASAC